MLSHAKTKLPRQSYFSVLLQLAVSSGPEYHILSKFVSVFSMAYVPAQTKNGNCTVAEIEVLQIKILAPNRILRLPVCVWSVSPFIFRSLISLSGGCTVEILHLFFSMLFCRFLWIFCVLNPIICG